MPRLNCSRIRLRGSALIAGIGVDCEEISRFEKMDGAFAEKIFTKREREYCRGKANPGQHLAARFAGKEAIIKCFGSAGKKVAFSQIEILKCENGAPVVNILSRDLRDYDAKLSLSHSGNMAIAFAVVFKSRGGIR